MTDFPNLMTRDTDRGLLSPFSGTPLGDMMQIQGNSASGITTTWVANRAVYLPVAVYKRVTITNLLINVITQAGNVDAGLYNWNGTRIVSNGGVACDVAGAQSIDIADTALAPGWYHLGFASDSSTAVFRHSTTISTVSARACGVQQQSTAYPLPSTATFAAYSVGVLPLIVGAYSTTL